MFSISPLIPNSVGFKISPVTPPESFSLSVCLHFWSASTSLWSLMWDAVGSRGRRTILELHRREEWRFWSFDANWGSSVRIFETQLKKSSFLSRSFTGSQHVFDAHEFAMATRYVQAGLAMVLPCSGKRVE